MEIHKLSTNSLTAKGFKGLLDSLLQTLIEDIASISASIGLSESEIKSKLVAFCESHGYYREHYLLLHSVGDYKEAGNQIP